MTPEETERAQVAAMAREDLEGIFAGMAGANSFGDIAAFFRVARDHVLHDARALEIVDGSIAAYERLDALAVALTAGDLPAARCHYSEALGIAEKLQDGGRAKKNVERCFPLISWVRIRPKCAG